MMRMRTLSIALVAIAMSAMLFGCSGAKITTSPAPSTSQQFGSVPQASSSAATQAKKPIELTNSYISRFGKVNHVTFPSFTFDYPDGWKITEESVQNDREQVSLTNDKGAEICFSMLPTGNAGYNLKMHFFSADISPVASSSFKPGYVQAEDLSNLGSFSVMSVDITGSDQKEEVYCVLPDSKAGTGVDLAGPFDKALAFPYVVDIAFYAFGPDNAPLEGDAKDEVLTILSSFRCDGDPIVPFGAK